MKTYLPTFLLLLILNSTANAQWQWVHPSPQGNDIRCMSFPNSVTGYAGADKGVILKSANSGAGWSQVYSNRFDPVTGIYFNSDVHGYVAQQEYFLNTMNGGTDWTVRYRFSDLNLDKIQFLNEDSGWVTGQFLGNWNLRFTADSGKTFQTQFSSSNKIVSFEFLADGRGWISTSNGNLEKTLDYGQNWQMQGSFNSTGFNDIQFIDTLNGFACAENGEIFNSTDGGQSWNPINNPASGTGLAYFTLHFTSATEGFVAGSEGFLISTIDGGLNWNVHGQAGWFNGYVFAETSTEIFLAGSNGEILGSTNGGSTWNSKTTAVSENSLNGITHTTSGYYTCGDMGLLLGGNGSAWSVINSGTSNSLYGISFSTVSNGIAVGESGTIIRSTNAGLSWGPVTSGTNEILHSAAPNGAVFFVCGDNETLIKSTNGGQTWTNVPTPLSGAGYHYVSVQFPAQDTGYVITDQNDLLYSVDGGLNWNISNIPAFGAITGVHFIDGLNGWMCSSFNEIYQTTDGGLNWSFLFQYSQPVAFSGIRFLNAQKGFVYGEGVLLQSSDGGNFWSAEYYPSAKKMNAIDLNGQDLITVGAGRSSILRRYENLEFNVADINLCMENSYPGTLTYSNPFSNRFGEIQLSDENGDFFNPYIVGTINPGQTAVSFLVPSGIVDASGYRLRAHLKNPPLYSNSTDAKTILFSPSVSIQASGPTVFCPGDSVTLFVGGNPGWTYQWFRDSIAISGANTEILTVYTTGNYTIQVYDVQCSFTSQAVDVVVSCTGIAELQASRLKVHPNPSGDFIQVNWPQEVVYNRIAITEPSGREIAAFPVNGNGIRIEIADLSQGVYLLEASGRNGRSVIRILKH